MSDPVLTVIVPPGTVVQVQPEPCPEPLPEPTPEPLPEPTPEPTPGTLGLDRCLVMEPLNGGPATLTVVHLHGNGQTPVSAMTYLRTSQYADSIRWVLPAGPVLSGDDWRWWEGSQSSAEEVYYARDYVETVLREVRARVDGPIVLSGFSAGAGAVFGLTEVVDLGDLVDGIVIMSGRFVHLAPAASPVPVDIWHGEDDPTVPLADMETTRDTLIAAGWADVHTTVVPGMDHAITDAVRDEVRAVISAYMVLTQ